MGWEIHSGICILKIINMGRGLTELLQSKKGAVFAIQGITTACVIGLQ